MLLLLLLLGPGALQPICTCFKNSRMHAAAAAAAAACRAAAGSHLLHEQLQAPRHGGLPGLAQDGVERLLPVLNTVVQAWWGQMQQQQTNQSNPHRSAYTRLNAAHTGDLLLLLLLLPVVLPGGKTAA
jgi:hypothetical protein